MPILTTSHQQQQHFSRVLKQLVATMSSANDSDDGSDSSSDVDWDVSVLVPEEILVIGLKILGFSDKQIARPKTPQKNNQRFVAHFGVMPHVLAQVWEDLQMQPEFNDMIKPVHRDFEVFLMAVHFLKRYQTEEEREGTWNISIRKLRDTTWQYVELIQKPKSKKIVWVHEDRDIWVGTVDGTHVKSQEPAHPTLPKDEKAFSYKDHAAGYSYELALSLHESRIIWMNGPFKASVHDAKIFAGAGGLAAKLRSIGKKMIAGSGYQGFDDCISRMHSLDSKRVAKFKMRARCRQVRFLCLFKCPHVNAKPLLFVPTGVIERQA